MDHTYTSSTPRSRSRPTDPHTRGLPHVPQHAAGSQRLIAPQGGPNSVITHLQRVQMPPTFQSASPVVLVHQQTPLGYSSSQPQPYQNQNVTLAERARTIAHTVVTHTHRTDYTIENVERDLLRHLPFLPESQWWSFCNTRYNINVPRGQASREAIAMIGHRPQDSVPYTVPQRGMSVAGNGTASLHLIGSVPDQANRTQPAHAVTANTHCEVATRSAGLPAPISGRVEYLPAEHQSRTKVTVSVPKSKLERYFAPRHTEQLPATSLRSGTGEDQTPGSKADPIDLEALERPAAVSQDRSRVQDVATHHNTRLQNPYDENRASPSIRVQQEPKDNGKRYTQQTLFGMVNSHYPSRHVLPQPAMGSPLNSLSDTMAVSASNHLASGETQRDIVGTGYLQLPDSQRYPMTGPPAHEVAGRMPGSSHATLQHETVKRPTLAAAIAALKIQQAGETSAPVAGKAKSILARAVLLAAGKLPGGRLNETWERMYPVGKIRFEDLLRVLDVHDSPAAGSTPRKNPIVLNPLITAAVGELVGPQNVQAQDLRANATGPLWHAFVNSIEQIRSTSGPPKPTNDSRDHSTSSFSADLESCQGGVRVTSQRVQSSTEHVIRAPPVTVSQLERADTNDEVQHDPMAPEPNKTSSKAAESLPIVASLSTPNSDNYVHCLETNEGELPQVNSLQEDELAPTRSEQLQELPQDLPQEVPQGLPQNLSQDLPQDLPHDLPQDPTLPQEHNLTQESRKEPGADQPDNQESEGNDRLVEEAVIETLDDIAESEHQAVTEILAPSFAIEIKDTFIFQESKASSDRFRELEDEVFKDEEDISHDDQALLYERDVESEFERQQSSTPETTSVISNSILSDVGTSSDDVIGFEVYKCGFRNCDAELHDYDTLIAHCDRVHCHPDDAGHYPCTWGDCAARRIWFHDPVRWQAHLDEEHQQSIRYVCRIKGCKMAFPYEEDLDLHMNNSHKDCFSKPKELKRKREMKERETTRKRRNTIPIPPDVEVITLSDSDSDSNSVSDYHEDEYENEDAQSSNRPSVPEVDADDIDLLPGGGAPARTYPFRRSKPIPKHPSPPEPARSEKRDRQSSEVSEPSVQHSFGKPDLDHHIGWSETWDIVEGISLGRAATGRRALVDLVGRNVPLKQTSNTIQNKNKQKKKMQTTGDAQIYHFTVI